MFFVFTKDKQLCEFQPEPHMASMKWTMAHNINQHNRDTLTTPITLNGVDESTSTNSRLLFKVLVDICSVAAGTIMRHIRLSEHETDAHEIQEYIGPKAHCEPSKQSFHSENRRGKHEYVEAEIGHFELLIKYCEKRSAHPTVIKDDIHNCDTGGRRGWRSRVWSDRT